MEENIIYHYHNEQLVGLTILRAKYTFIPPTMTVPLKMAEPVFA